jgi:hypothetical protein
MTDLTASLSRRSVGALVASVALALASCASESPDTAFTDDVAPDGDVAGDAPGVPDDPGETFADAIDATRASDTAAVDLSIGVESPIGGGAVDLSGELTTDDVGSITATASAVDAPSFEVEMRSDGDTVWITSDAPEIDRALPSGVSWVEASLDELRDDDVWTGLDSTFDVLSVLRGVDDVADAGTIEVGGDEIRLLEGEVDWEAALDASGPDERDRLEETITLSGDTEIRDFTVTVGLDGDNRVRVLDLEVIAGPPSDSSDDSSFMDEVTLRMRLEVAEVDHEVEMPDAPPADETVPISEVPEVAEALADGL